MRRWNGPKRTVAKAKLWCDLLVAYIWYSFVKILWLRVLEAQASGMRLKDALPYSSQCVWLLLHFVWKSHERHGRGTMFFIWEKNDMQRRLDALIALAFVTLKSDWLCALDIVCFFVSQRAGSHTCKTTHQHRGSQGEGQFVLVIWKFLVVLDQI